MEHQSSRRSIFVDWMRGAPRSPSENDGAEGATDAGSGRLQGLSVAEKGGDKLLLRATPFVSGKELANAQAILDPITNRPIVAFRLNTEGASKLAVFSQSNIARPFAIVVDDRVISAPTIQDPILNGEGMISGSFTMAEAQELAAKLMSGACR